MKNGELYYDITCNRLDIKFDDGSYYGGLHCGDTLEVYSGKAWTPTRVEMGVDLDGEDDWYLVGLYAPGRIPPDLFVRI